MSTRPSITLESNQTRTAVISLGSNQGFAGAGPDQVLRQAWRELSQYAAGPTLISSLYETEPVGCPPQTPQFINAVGAFPVAPAITAEALLRGLLELENRFGRQRRSEQPCLRTLDLDLVCLGREQLAQPGLVLPHPRSHQRRFVLQPLAELAPDLKLPGQPVSVAALLAELPAAPGVRRLGPA